MKPDELRALANEIEREGMTGALSAKFMRWRYPPSKYSLGHNDEIPLNLQDAVDAVPEGYYWCVDCGRPEDLCCARLIGNKHTVFSEARAETPAAALCCAILRAKAAELDDDAD